MATPAPVRRTPSPLIGQLRDQLARTSKRISTVRAELKKSYSPGIIWGLQLSTVAGGAACGAGKGFVGDGWLMRGISSAVGLGLISLGAWGVDGAAGGAVAAFGGGILAKNAGDVAEDALEGRGK
jgi:hypothetical protein